METALHQVTGTPPYTHVEPITETLHGVAITDPYRWLEDQYSPRTRDWLAAQTQYARGYLDALPQRERIRGRILELLDVETYDCIQTVGNRYVFRKRLRGQQQSGIYLRDGVDGRDQLLIDPADRKTGDYTAVRPIQLSPDGRLLLYEIKQGGERTGTFELLDIEKREKLPDALPRGYLRAFCFAPDAASFYYVHEAPPTKVTHARSAYQHLLGTAFEDDREIFCAGHDENLRVVIIPGDKRLGFMVFKFGKKTHLDFYVWPLDIRIPPELVIDNAEYRFGPVLLRDRILAITDRDSPNSKIIEVLCHAGCPPEFNDIVPESRWSIREWSVTANRIYVAYSRGVRSPVHIFGLQGKKLGTLPECENETIRIIGSSFESDELLIERESFTKPIEICRYNDHAQRVQVWSQRLIPFDSKDYACLQEGFPAKDGTRIPLFLVGKRDVLSGGMHPTIMTSYGGYGVAMTPQFSVFVSFLMECGCVFALPNIRGGAEFGVAWHNAAKRRNRQVAIDDFLAAAEWLIAVRRTKSEKLAIFGGSNSGLLVGAAMTQRPELFRAVVCMVPILDMLRYHLFDDAHLWVEEFGTADNPDDFRTLVSYSPYHQVRDGVEYPAVMIISGDADQSCNPLHARKMTARLQAANVGRSSIILDYSSWRGHSPVLPLGERIHALTDRMAFLCDQLGLRL